MKTKIKSLIFLIAIISLSMNLSRCKRDDINNQVPAGYQLACHYPFSSDMSDATGNCADALVHNSPIVDKSIYSNGIYLGDDAAGSEITTPNIYNFTPDKFIIELEFNADTLSKPIIIGGDLQRCIAVNLQYDGHLQVITYHDGEGANSMYSNTLFSLGTWYKIALELSNGEVTLKVNGQVDSSLLISGSILFNNNYNFSNTHSGMGSTYKGYWRNLKIYIKE